MSNEKGFGTRAIHEGNVKETQFGALTTPIYQTSTFVFDNCAQGAARFAGKEDGFIYTRLGNPTLKILQDKVAALEGGEACQAASSGMGAISSCIWSIAGAGQKIVADKTLYGCTFALLSEGVTHYGVEVEFIDTSDIEQLKAALTDNTCMVYLETPANPNMKIADIRAVADTAHNFKKDIKVVCDNTFSSPYCQRPLSLGADVVVHSATKYLNGHGDVIAGFVIGDSEFIQKVAMFGVKDMTGSVLGPFEAFLILRGLKTLEVRMQRHCENGMKVAQYLESNPKVTKVNYPGLESFPGHDIAAKQMYAYGGMVSFEVATREAGEKLCNSLKMCTLAVSLGDAETLIEHPASMTHSAYSAEELKDAGIQEGLIRLSCGLENPEDIIADLEDGFAQI
ncbi:MAG: methionine gamma-lyase [Eubacteriaceae bacterium]|jgi:methionine-gamma-lyase|nr:methionine gamma-lyase [Eubacteriaceae bacterium]